MTTGPEISTIPSLYTDLRWPVEIPTGTINRIKAQFNIPIGVADEIFREASDLINMVGSKKVDTLEDAGQRLKNDWAIAHYLEPAYQIYRAELSKLDIYQAPISPVLKRFHLAIEGMSDIPQKEIWKILLEDRQTMDIQLLKECYEQTTPLEYLDNFMRPIYEADVTVPLIEKIKNEALIRGSQRFYDLFNATKAYLMYNLHHVNR